MMRLTEITRTGNTVRLEVEGWIASEYADLLERECSRRLDQGQVVRLDCSRVTYVDGRGAAALRALRQRRLLLVNCPPLILEIVDRLRP